MPFIVPIEQARQQYPEYEFVAALSPSEQKAAFHVRDRTGADLCLKLIAENCNLDRVNREILALTSVAHPNVVSFKEYTLSTSGGIQRHHLIEDFVEGADLADALATESPWTTQRASEFFAQLSDGLAALHSIGVVHRDLKPRNIRVRRDGTPVIIDFGLSRHLQLADLTHTEDGAGLGTPLYFAPEQFEGTKHDIDRRTDLFAMGVLLYESLVGRHPFRHTRLRDIGELREAVCRSVEHLTVPEFTALPRLWTILIGRLLAKERVHRPSGAAQVSKLLRQLGGSA